MSAGRLAAEPWRLAFAAYPFQVTLQTRFADLDINAHLNNVAIARLFEESRLRFHRDIRGCYQGVDPGALMIAHIGIDYLHEGRYPQDVASGVAVAHVGGRSYRLAIGLFQQGRAFALADCVMVHRDAPSPALRDALMARAPVVGESG